MFTKNQKTLIVRLTLLLAISIGMFGIVPATAGAAGAIPQVQIITPTYPIGMNAGENKLVSYKLQETANVSGKFTSKSVQFFTQYDMPLSEPIGPYATNIQVNALSTTNWDETIFLPENVMSKARSMNKFTIVLKTTFSGTSTTGTKFSAESSLLLLLPPDSFGKVSPADGGFASTNDLSLQWNSSVGATDYEYCFDTIDNNSCDTQWTGTYWLSTYDTFAKLKTLPSTTFYWQVRATNLAGKAYSDNGKWWSFTTCNVPGATRITVENTNDSGPGSLRQAIYDICQGGTIKFAPQLSGQTITLSTTLKIDKNITINGSSLLSKIRISGNNNVGVLETKASNGVTLDSLLIRDGHNSWGGGISNLGVLTLVNCVISNNSSDYNGGGVANFGELTLINTTISGNTAASDGGGIYNDYYVDSVSSHSGKLTLTDSIIADNIANYGGGIYTRAGGEVITVINSKFSNNSAVFAYGGGISNGGVLEVLNSTFLSNTAEGDGGGIYNGSESILTVIGSTFSENSVGSENSIDGWGGAIFNSDYGVINVTNSTFVKNVAGSGGAIFNYGNPFYPTTLTITNSTFSANSAITGGSIYNMGTLNLTNSILANSTTGNDCYHADFNGGTIGTNVNNLIEGNAITPHNCGTPLLTTDPLLGPLQSNGGVTQTMAPGEDSPAINAGDDASCPSIDQRGVTRPQGSHCDIGAYEEVVPKHPVLKSKVLHPSFLTTQTGTTNGYSSSLNLLDQIETDDDPAAYVSFQTTDGPYRGYQSFSLPEGTQAKLISTMLLQLNVKAPASSTQVWTWSIYDWSSNMWIKVGDSKGLEADQWQGLVFRIRQPWKYVSPGNEIRIQLSSNNANGDLKVDYEALHVTYLSLPATSTPVAPIVPSNRPGISSVPIQTSGR